LVLTLGNLLHSYELDAAGEGKAPLSHLSGQNHQHFIGVADCLMLSF